MPELPKLYREDNTKLEGRFLDDEVYSKALSALVVVCTDIVLINKERRTFFLAKRTIESMKGWWCMGGRMMRGETELDSVRRLMKRETSLDVATSRFTYVTTNRYWCKYREQEPQEEGGDYICFVFALELGQDEIAAASANLDPAEYEPTLGLVECARDDLLELKVRPQLIDLYDRVFA